MSLVVLSEIKMTTQKRQTPRVRTAATGIIAGFNKGHKTTPRARPVSRKARLSLPHKKLRAVKAIITELVGLSPWTAVQELLRVGKEKRALKFCNKRGQNHCCQEAPFKMEDALRRWSKK